jgi:hypothetical protein
MYLRSRKQESYFQPQHKPRHHSIMLGKHRSLTCPGRGAWRELLAHGPHMRWARGVQPTLAGHLHGMAAAAEHLVGCRRHLMLGRQCSLQYRHTKSVFNNHAMSFCGLLACRLSERPWPTGAPFTGLPGMQYGPPWPLGSAAAWLPRWRWAAVLEVPASTACCCASRSRTLMKPGAGLAAVLLPGPPAGTRGAGGLAGDAMQELASSIHAWQLAHEQAAISSRHAKVMRHSCVPASIRGAEGAPVDASFCRLMRPPVPGRIG